MRTARGKAADIRHAVGGNNILCRPAGDFARLREPFACFLAQVIVSAAGAGFPGAVIAAAKQQIGAIMSEGTAVSGFIDQHAVGKGGVFQRDNVGALPDAYA